MSRHDRGQRVVSGAGLPYEAGCVYSRDILGILQSASKEKVTVSPSTVVWG